MCSARSAGDRSARNEVLVDLGKLGPPRWNGAPSAIEFLTDSRGCLRHAPGVSTDAGNTAIWRDYAEGA
jgi:hypothetical protein